MRRCAAAWPDGAERRDQAKPEITPIASTATNAAASPTMRQLRIRRRYAQGTAATGNASPSVGESPAISAGHFELAGGGQGSLVRVPSGISAATPRVVPKTR